MPGRLFKSLGYFFAILEIEFHDLKSKLFHDAHFLLDQLGDLHESCSDLGGLSKKRLYSLWLSTFRIEVSLSVVEAILYLVFLIQEFT